MEQFNLSEWLKDKSRKVITRNGMEAEIIHDSFPLVAIINGVAYNFDHDGKFQSNKTNHKYDLFFADGEEELTEFEEAIYQYICIIVTSCDGKVYGDKELKPIVKGIAKELIDLARKELEKDIEHSAVEFAKSYMEDVNPSFEKVQESEELWKWKMSCLRGINKAYTQGKQDALKDLPKWKKATENKDFDSPVLLFECEKEVVLTERIYKDEYYIELSDLKTLPKEE